MCQNCLSNTGQTYATASFRKKVNQQLQKINLYGLSPLDPKDERPFSDTVLKNPSKGKFKFGIENERSLNSDQKFHVKK